MKKFLTLCATSFLVLAIAGCENESPDKLIGHTLYNPSQEIESTAKTISYTSAMIGTVGNSYADGGEASGSSSVSASVSYPSMPEVTGPDSEGFFKIVIDPDTFYVRWLDSGKTDLSVDNAGNTALENLQATITVANDNTNGADYFDIKGDFRELKYPSYAPALEGITIVENKPDFTLKLNATGDLDVSNGAIANGEWKSVYESAGQSVFEFTDLNIKSEPLDNGRKWYVAGGEGTGETILHGTVYASDVSFNSEGEGEGTLSAGYEVEFLVDTYNGGGWYKDSDGKHSF